MNKSPDPFASIEELVPQHNHELVFRFFLAFSRFECALKHAGFMKDGKAEANWDTFASKYYVVFARDQTPELREACDYFLQHPARRQIVKDGNLDWSEPFFRGNQPMLTWLVVSICCVRNNLFHGGKFPFGPGIDEPARDPQLFRHALTILSACLRLNDVVTQHFEAYKQEQH